MFIWTGSTGSTSLLLRKVYSLFWLHDFSVTIPRCYKDVYINSFFPRTARLWNSLPIECFPFPLTYDLSGFKSRINRHLLTVGSFETDFLCALIFFMLLFLVTPCLVVAVQPCMECFPIKKKFVCMNLWHAKIFYHYLVGGLLDWVGHLFFLTQRLQLLVFCMDGQ